MQPTFLILADRTDITRAVADRLLELVVTDEAGLSSDALRVMNENAVSVLFVVDDGKLAGILHMHDIVRARVA